MKITMNHRPPTGHLDQLLPCPDHRNCEHPLLCCLHLGLKTEVVYMKMLSANLQYANLEGAMLEYGQFNCKADLRFTKAVTSTRLANSDLMQCQTDRG